MSALLVASVALMLGGLAGWMAAAEIARGWLERNVAGYAPPSAMARAAMGVLGAVGPVRDYASRRRALGEPARAALWFWASLASSVVGFVLFAVYLCGRT